MVSELLNKAIAYASEKHRGQLYEGQSFMVHPIQTYELLKIVAPDDDNLLCAAVLHDVIEDGGVSHAQLEKDFNKDIADLVSEVTHEGAKDDHGYYFPRLKTKRGILLKFADRLSNLSHMDEWDKKRQAQYLLRSKFWKSE